MMDDIDYLRWEASKAQLELLGYKYGMTVPEKNYVPGQTLAYVPYMTGFYVLSASSDMEVYWDHHRGNGKRDRRIPVGAPEEGSEDYEFWRRKVFDNFPTPVREQYEQKLLGELWDQIWSLADNMAAGEGPALASAYLAHIVFQQVRFVLDHYPSGDRLLLKSSATGDFFGDSITVAQLVKHRAFGSELTQWIIDTAFAVFYSTGEKESKDDEDADEDGPELP